MLMKYPRTMHLPWSPGATEDDVRLIDVTNFVGKEVVVTEKMDGENTTMYSDHIHARSLDSAHHPSRTWVKSLHAGVSMDIPKGWRVCGENLFARHSIGYDSLPSYFMVFSIWNTDNEALSWDETLEWCELLGLVPVPVLFRGTWDERAIRNLYNPSEDAGRMEGYVVRLAGGIPYKAFGESLAKFVRRDHVQTDEHWMTKAVVPNGLRKV